MTITGAEARSPFAAYAALKGRSSAASPDVHGELTSLVSAGVLCLP